MSQVLMERPPTAAGVMPAIPELADIDWRAISQDLITEDDEPLDNILSEKLQRLLVEPLYTSWQPPPYLDEPDAPRPFLASANVGVFYSRYKPPIVPDVFVSLDVTLNPEWIADEHRSYFIWEMGKPPDVVVEIVSNKIGNELTSKARLYARLGVLYYIVFDPFQQLGQGPLRVFDLGAGLHYQPRHNHFFPELGFGVTLWRGAYQGMTELWLRWCDADGNLLPTGAERAAQEAERAAQEAERADQEAERADQEAERAAQAEDALAVERAQRQELEAELARLRAALAQRNTGNDKA